MKTNMKVSVKQLTENIDDALFDFDQLNDEIEDMCHKNGISERMNLNTQLAIEEIVHRCVIGFLEHNDGGFGYPIKLTINFSLLEEKASLTITYSGPRFDPFEYGDELSVLLVEKLSAQSAYSYDGMNKVVVILS